MKTITLIFILVLLVRDNNIKPDCSCKNVVLYGRVRVVDIAPTFKVKINNTNPDLLVKKVDFPGKCGEWKFVDIDEDFTVQFVDLAPDFTVKFVDIDPGIH